MENFENAQKTNTFVAALKGYTAFSSNFMKFAPIKKPAYLCSLGIILMHAPAIFSFMPLYNALFTAFFGIILFLWNFWEYMCSLIGASYLCKDILENVPYQGGENYIKFAKQHTVSYIKFLLWLMLFSTVACIVWGMALGVGLLGVFEVDKTNIPYGWIFPAVTLLLIPFLGACWLSFLCFAYQDKTHPLHSIINAFKDSYSLKNIVPFSFLIVVMHILAALVLSILLIIYFACTGLYAFNLAVLSIITNVFLILVPYAIIASLTGYYLNLRKD